MLSKLKLKNYRCFENTELNLKKLTLIVGSNNSGKSTITEALRVIGLAVRKLHSNAYVFPPSFLGLPLGTKGINIRAEELGIDLRTIVYLYKDNVPAEIIADFGRDIRIHIFLTQQFVFAQLVYKNRNIIKKSEAAKLRGMSLHVMPQLSLIQEDEPRLSEETVLKSIETRLSSRHFRNEIYQFRDKYFETFRETAQRTWKGLRIQDIHFDVLENKISLIVHDSGYSAEIGLMGSGLQMWLQIIWFICRNEPDTLVVLDEPDVYMHPDLQRKILEVVRDKFSQVIIATHSVEIISDVEPGEIITVDKKTRKLRYADSYSAVQEVINNLGSIHNLSLTRIGNAGKCIFVEGNDIKDLSRFQRILRIESDVTVDQLPTIRLGGWSRFDEALGAAKLFYNETKGEIKTFCILDRDFHTQSEIADLYKKAQENHLYLHVWEKKELENYIVTPKSVFRFLELSQEDYQLFEKEFFDLLDVLYDDTRNSIMDYLSSQDRGKEPSYYLQKACEVINDKWNSIEGRLSIANGKDIISTINSWARKKYKKSCSKVALFNALTADDVDNEIKTIIEEILT